MSLFFVNRCIALNNKFIGCLHQVYSFLTKHSLIITLTTLQGRLTKPYLLHTLDYKPWQDAFGFFYLNSFAE